MRSLGAGGVGFRTGFRVVSVNGVNECATCAELHAAYEFAVLDEDSAATEEALAALEVHQHSAPES